MIPDRMRPDDAHCGPVAIGIVTGIKPEVIMSEWPTRWDDPKTDRKWKLWPIDTPWLHRKYLEGVLGLHMIQKPKDAPLNAKDICLVHNCTLGDSWIKNLWNGFWGQHWCVILEATDEYVVVDWGAQVNPTRTFTRERFDLMLKGSWPFCVYSLKP